VSGSLPLIMTDAGPSPTPPATLNAALIALVASTNPGYTVLGGGLIEDLASTATGALVAIDQARVDSVNDVTPLGANAFVLAALGQQQGLPQGSPANGNVYVTFTGAAGAYGYVFPAGFLVSDGANQYALQDGGVVSAATGSTGQLYAVATSSGTFPIPANTVTQVVTSIPSPYDSLITVTNPQAGIPAAAAETVQSYRSRVLQAGIVASTGTPAFLKTALYAITGVRQQLVSIPSLSGGYQVICGGGDAYQVANAILQSVENISLLQGSQLAITAMTAANPVVITTNLAHGFVAGNTSAVAGASPSGFNTTYTVVSVTPFTITTATNGSAFGTYIGGALLAPNPRNVTVSLIQAPNIYSVTFVNPPQQVVTVVATWNTTVTSFTAGAAVNQLAASAMQDYINSVPVGQPINLLELTAVFQNAVAPVLPTINLTTLQFVVTINGVTASPASGTSAIFGDAESYFYCSATGATSVQG
jgi:hypothetical protein